MVAAAGEAQTVHEPVGVEDGAAAAALVNDDRGDGDGARGLKDRVAKVHGIAAEVIQDKTAGGGTRGRRS